LLVSKQVKLCVVSVDPYELQPGGGADVSQQIVIRLYDPNPAETVPLMTQAAAEADLSAVIKPYGLRGAAQEATTIVLATAGGTILAQLATETWRRLRRSMSDLLTRLAANRLERVARCSVTISLDDAELLLRPSEATEALGTGLDTFLTNESPNLQGDKPRFIWNKNTKTWKLDSGP
jgi:hypothetical protein